MESLKSIQAAIALDTMDWSLVARHSWIYAIVFGWGTAMTDQIELHGWTDSEVGRLKLLREEFMQLVDISAAAMIPHTSGLYEDLCRQLIDAPKTWKPGLLVNAVEQSVGVMKDKDAMLALAARAWDRKVSADAAAKTLWSEAAVHPLDDSLGDINQMSIRLHIAGFTQSAATLAEAHEKIQAYLIEHMVEL